MKLFFNVLVCDFKRTIFSFRFLVAIIGFTFVTIVTMFDELPYLQPSFTSVVYIYQIIRYLDFHIVYLIFAAIPGTLLFCSDWDNRFIRFSIIRCSKRKYAISKAVICFYSAVSVVLLSEFLTLSLFGLQFPIINSNDINLGIYNSFAFSDKIWIFFLIKILFESLCAGALCVCALWLSTIIINVFVTLATPLLAYYLISTVSYSSNIPGIFNINNLSKGYVSINNDPLLSFLFTILVFLILTIVFGGLFVRNCTRRIENG